MQLSLQPWTLSQRLLHPSKVLVSQLARQTVLQLTWQTSALRRMLVPRWGDAGGADYGRNH